MQYHPDKNPDAGDKFKEIRFVVMNDTFTDALCLNKLLVPSPQVIYHLIPQQLN